MWFKFDYRNKFENVHMIFLIEYTHHFFLIIYNYSKPRKIALQGKIRQCMLHFIYFLFSRKLINFNVKGSKGGEGERERIIVKDS